ncbi:hypothetical protein WJX84_005849 [Apatococcus fuscideae]|uniref:Uncharacterized protein n=1 Tax=Apatococcus fuscideae TaxID=2026836 RepID=A0AAW1SZH2_9CHLO
MGIRLQSLATRFEGKTSLQKSGQVTWSDRAESFSSIYSGGRWNILEKLSDSQQLKACSHHQGTQCWRQPPPLAAPLAPFCRSCLAHALQQGSALASECNSTHPCDTQFLLADGVRWTSQG